MSYSAFLYVERILIMEDRNESNSPVLKIRAYKNIKKNMAHNEKLGMVDLYYFKKNKTKPRRLTSNLIS